MNTEAASLTEIAEYVYSDMMDENGDDSGIAYLDEFHFAPCVHLPTFLIPPSDG